MKRLLRTLLTGISLHRSHRLLLPVLLLLSAPAVAGELSTYLGAQAALINRLCVCSESYEFNADRVPTLGLEWSFVDQQRPRLALGGTLSLGSGMLPLSEEASHRLVVAFSGRSFVELRVLSVGQTVLLSPQLGLGPRMTHGLTLNRRAMIDLPVVLGLTLVEVGRLRLLTTGAAPIHPRSWVGDSVYHSANEDRPLGRVDWSVTLSFTQKAPRYRSSR